MTVRVLPPSVCLRALGLEGGMCKTGPRSREDTGDPPGGVRASDGGLTISPSLLLTTEKSRLPSQLSPHFSLFPTPTLNSPLTHTHTHMCTHTHTPILMLWASGALSTYVKQNKYF